MSIISDHVDTNNIFDKILYRGLPLNFRKILLAVKYLLRLMRLKSRKTSVKLVDLPVLTTRRVPWLPGRDWNTEKTAPVNATPKNGTETSSETKKTVVQL